MSKNNDTFVLAKVEQEFGEIIKACEERKKVLGDMIHSIASDKFKTLKAQLEYLREFNANYEKAMASFNQILNATQNENQKSSFAILFFYFFVFGSILVRRPKQIIKKHPRKIKNIGRINNHNT